MPAFAQDVSKCVDAQKAKISGRFDEAVSLYTECIDQGELSSRNRAIALNNRGNVHLDQMRYNFAIQDFDAALELDPKYAKSLNNRGLAYQGKGLFHFALRDFKDAIEADPQHMNAYNNLAWIHATCPDDSIRDGGKAIALARKVVEATESKDPGSLDTLAAAYAESGDFDSAIRFQKQAIELASGTYLDTLITRLLQYRNNKPYRF
jgi:tetratricopeptide (TPR) repeat protein